MQIVLFLVLILLIVVVISTKTDSLSNGTKIYMALGAIMIFVAMYFYNSMQTNNEEYNRQIVNAYMQGKTLTCKAYKVDKKDFLYISGTSTFVSRSDKKELQGVSVQVSTCNTGQ